MQSSAIFDRLVEDLGRSFASLPDHPSGENTRYEIKDAVMSAFWIFFTKSRSFLAYQRLMAASKGKNNVQTLFGAERIPSDAQIRNLLDSHALELLYTVFEAGLQALQEGGQLNRFRNDDEQLLISCDGTGIISS